jgi:hypothetical protein
MLRAEACQLKEALAEGLRDRAQALFDDHSAEQLGRAFTLELVSRSRETNSLQSSLSPSLCLMDSESGQYLLRIGDLLLLRNGSGTKPLAPDGQDEMQQWRLAPRARRRRTARASRGSHAELPPPPLACRTGRCTRREGGKVYCLDVRLAA